VSRFLAGILVGLLAGGGGVYVALVVLGPDRGEPTARPAADPQAPAEGDKGDRRKRRRGGGRARAGGTGGGEGEGEVGDEPIPTLAPGDEKIVAEGDALRPRARTLDMADEGQEVRDLEQGEIDAAVGARAQAIIGCISDARGAAPLSGRVTVGFVVSGRGSVAQTRVEAPAYLMRNGLARCVRPKLAALRFPATGKDTVVTVPFDVN